MDLSAELAVAIEATRAAGDEVARMRRDGLRYGHKDGWELVSDADVRASEMLHEALTTAYPGDGWLGEEDKDNAERLSKERVWIVDPIDGTREFLQGVPEYAVSVGLVIRGKPALGVVYNPAQEDMHAAICFDAEERPSTESTGRPFDVLVGRGEHRHDEVPPLPKGARTKPMGSVAYRLALVADGRAECVLSGYGRAEWDVAAGAALCFAAGLRFTDILGFPIPFNQPDPQVRGLLAAEPGLHTRLAAHFHELVRRS